MSLLELQRGFRGCLLEPSRDAVGIMAGNVAPGLAVYQNAYRAQLVSALKDSYERLWAWLGDDAFEAAARDHIDAHPPSSWTLGDYGADLADTVAALYPDDPEVAEIAALDWALRRAFDGPDAPPYDLARVADVDWEQARIHFVPTLRLIPVTTNCGLIWNAIAAGDDVPPATMLPEPAWIRVWRVELQPHFATIEADERQAIDGALSGQSFARLCDGLAGQHGVEHAVDRAGALLSAWLGDGLIADIA